MDPGIWRRRDGRRSRARDSPSPSSAGSYWQECNHCDGVETGSACAQCQEAGAWLLRGADRARAWAMAAARETHFDVEAALWATDPKRAAALAQQRAGLIERYPERAAALYRARLGHRAEFATPVDALAQAEARRLRQRGRDAWRPERGCGGGTGSSSRPPRTRRAQRTFGGRLCASWAGMRERGPRASLGQARARGLSLHRCFGSARRVVWHPPSCNTALRARGGRAANAALRATGLSQPVHRCAGSAASGGLSGRPRGRRAGA